MELGNESKQIFAKTAILHNGVLAEEVITKIQKEFAKNGINENNSDIRLKTSYFNYTFKKEDSCKDIQILSVPIMTVTVATTDKEIYESTWMSWKKMIIQRKKKTTVIPLIDGDKRIYSLSFRSDDPSFSDLQNFKSNLFYLGFKPDYVGFKEKISNDNLNQRLVFLLYIDQHTWLSDQTKKVTIGAQMNTAGKRILKSVNPWNNNQSFLFGNFISIIFYFLSFYTYRSISNSLMHAINGNTTTHTHKFLNFNINGITNKINKINFLLDKFSPLILSLNEIKILKDKKKYISKQIDSNYKILYNISTTNGNAGNCIIIKKEFYKKIIKIELVPAYVLSIEMEVNNAKIKYITIYNPNKNSIDYKRNFKSIKLFLDKVLGEYDTNYKIIIQGDFNEYNESIDHKSGNGQTLTNKPILCNHIKRKFKLLDIDRLITGKNQFFTHQINAINGLSQSRIDITFISKNLIKFFVNSNVLFNFEDEAHKVIHIEVNISVDLGQCIIPGSNVKDTILKFNTKKNSKEEILIFNTLLTNNNVASTISEVYQEINKNLLLAAKKSFERKIITNEIKKPKKKSQAMQRTFNQLYELQTDTKTLQQKENELKKILKKFQFNDLLGSFCSENINSITIKNYIQIIINNLNRKIQKRNKKKMKRAMVRREKRFFNEQKRNIINIFGKKQSFDDPFYLRISDRVITTNEDINHHIEQYFKKIYSQDYQNITAIPEVVNEINETIYESISDKILLKEMEKAIKEMGKNKAPGP